MSDRFVLNLNEHGMDVVHRNPREECNLDDAEGRETIDEATYHALLEHQAALPCRHCTEGTE